MSDDTTKNFPEGEDESGGSINTGDRIGTILGLVESMGTNLEDVKDRLGTLEKSVGERLYDTKPIWERALSEIMETRSEVAELRSEVAGIKSQVTQTQTDVGSLRSEMGDSLRKLGKKIELLVEDVFAVRTENRILGKQIDKLESKTS